MEKFPLMSPAKMFAYMKERESKAEQQEAHKVSSSTRDLFGAGECVIKLKYLKKQGWKVTKYFYSNTIFKGALCNFFFTGL